MTNLPARLVSWEGLLIVVGIGLLLWAISAGFGTNPNNRAEVFSGNIGGCVNLLVIIVAGLLIYWGVT